MDRLITKYQSMFRLLNGWNITYNTTARYKNQCDINPSNKKAIIYEWTGDAKELGDFIFHEILHINFAAMGDYGSREWFDNEETFVRDICNFMNRIRG
jgi:hypothetical protein